MADRVGFSAATIRKLEAEERRPSAQIAGLLAEIFGIPIEERQAFLGFARGDLEAAPVDITAVAPWSSSGAPARTNLPAPLTAIIGRAGEIALIIDYLLTASTRLVTLIGPPGIGKTRLSLEVGREMLVHFPDGVFFVSLAPFDNPDLIAPTIAQALGFVEVKGLSQVERLKDGIGDKHLLLVLDNLEHLISPAALLVTDLLLACPHLKILTTSREALRVSGEWLYPVPALEYPEVQQFQTENVEVLSRFTALMLFEERARAVRPDFVLDSGNFGTVSAICQRLDGLPLAIELVSARIRLMSTQDLLGRMSDTFTLYADGMRALPDRQKTLHAAIGWSYDLLSSDERQLFARLSVFSGGFSLEAVENAFSPTALDKSVAVLLASLLDKSLMQRTVDAQGNLRFYMLVTIQQYALERLRESGEERMTRDQHLAYFLALAEKAHLEIHGPKQLEWIDFLEMERENYRAALDWCVPRQDAQPALRLLVAVAWAWWLRGQSMEVRAWFDKIISLPETRQYPNLYARLLNHLGQQSWLLGDFTYARSVLEESQGIWLKLGAEGELGLAETWFYLGLVVDSVDADHTKAQALHEQSLEICRRNNYLFGKARAKFGLAWVADGRDQDALALSLCQQSLDLFTQIGDCWGIARSSQIFGQVQLKLGNYEQARLLFDEYLRMDEGLNFNQGIVSALTNLGQLYRYQGEYAQSELFYQRSLMLSREHDFKWDSSVALYYLGLLELHRNDYWLAEWRFIQSYNVTRMIIAVDITACDLLLGLAAVAGGTHQPERAAKLSGAAEAILNTIDYRIPMFDQAEFERHIRIARMEFGEARFDELVKQSRQMPLDQAIAYALEDTLHRSGRAA